MIKRLPLAITILIISCSTPAFAGQFDSVIDAIATKKTDDYNVQMWDNTHKIKGVKWQSQHPKFDNNIGYIKIGTTKVGKNKAPHIGATEVSVIGARTFITDIIIDINNEGGIYGTEKDINYFFGPGSVKKVATSCDLDNVSDSSETYVFQKSGYKPVAIRYETSWGASGVGGVTITVSYDLDHLISSCADYDIYSPYDEVVTEEF